MPFIEESTGYEKTILSDLQGAWSLLRQNVVDAAGFEGWDRALFHIDEAMSWGRLEIFVGCCHFSLLLGIFAHKARRRKK